MELQWNPVESINQKNRKEISAELWKNTGFIEVYIFQRDLRLPFV